MFPIKHSWIFRSRWVALLWAAGMIWFALDIAGTDAIGQRVDPEEARRRLEH